MREMSLSLGWVPLFSVMFQVRYASRMPKYKVAHQFTLVNTSTVRHHQGWTWLTKSSHQHAPFAGEKLHKRNGKGKLWVTHNYLSCQEMPIFMQSNDNLLVRRKRYRNGNEKAHSFVACENRLFIQISCTIIWWVEKKIAPYTTLLKWKWKKKKKDIQPE